MLRLATILDDIPVVGNDQNPSHYGESRSPSPEDVTDQGLDSLPAIVPVDEIEQVLVQEPELDHFLGMKLSKSLFKSQN